MGNSLSSIGINAFSSCTALTAVTIPRSVKAMGENPFYRCTALNTIKVENGNTVYDSRNGCNAIIETSTGTLITGCKGTVIPDGVISIGRIAFSSLTSLTGIHFPGSVKTIGQYSFNGCNGLQEITFDECWSKET